VVGRVQGDGLTFDTIRHDEVCGPRPSLMLGYWGMNWGLGFVWELDRPKMLRVLCGRKQWLVRGGKSSDKMTPGEIHLDLVRSGISPVELGQRTKERVAELKRRLDEQP